MQAQGKISFVAAVLMNINVIVGVGIYFLPQAMVQLAGSFSFLGWIAAGLLLFPVVWTVATAARIFPGTGGFYNYCATGIGPVYGFVALWAYFLGFLAVVAAQLTFLKNLLHDNAGMSIIEAMPIIVNLVLIGTIAILNLLDVRLISKIQSLATVLKLLPLIGVIGVFAFYWNSGLTYSMPDLAGVGMTLPMALFGYWGFESCTSTSHMIEGGSSKASSVLLTAFFISVSLYCLFHFGITHIMGTDAIAAQGAVGFVNYLGLSDSAHSFANMAIVGILILALFNAAYGVTLANVSNLFNIASKNHVVGARTLRKVNRFDRPGLVILLQAVFVFCLMTFVSAEQILVALSNFGLITANVLTTYAVLKMQRKQKVSLLAKIITYLSLVSCAVLVYFSWRQIGATHSLRLLYAAPFIFGIVGGLVMFYATKKEKK